MFVGDVKKRKYICLFLMKTHVAKVLKGIKQKGGLRERSKHLSGVGTSAPCDITKGNQQVEKLQTDFPSLWNESYECN